MPSYKMNDLFLRALRCEAVERPPVWLMRQAGRYMPEYQALRTKHSLWQLFHEPELAAQVTFLPIDLLDVDAAILFSDILVLAEAFGKKIVFPDKGGPFVDPFIQSSQEAIELVAKDVREVLHYVTKTIHLVKQKLKVPFIGFCAGPFTLASYMIEGAGKNGFQKTKAWIQEDPKSFHILLSKITDASIEYLRMQIEAGVDALQLFDSWANVLEESQFVEFCLPYWKKIKDSLSKPLIVFCRDSRLYAEQISLIQPAGISFDEKADMAQLRKVVPQGIAIQGNLSPEFLRDASVTEVSDATQKLLESLEREGGFIVNLGHGVLPLTPMENVRAFVGTVKQMSLKLLQ